MNERGAVFLSYASQDAAAAQRICAALRAAGVEVWFDQNELRGGDAWDAKIRRQIKECALFVPIISAHTQARPEGYFRLEWKLAVDRSHLMSDDHPFLFPVVIDDTPDATARVPERFKDVQWTRLDLRDTPETLAMRVAGLLAKADAGAALAAPRATAEKRTTNGWAKVGMLVGLIFALVYGLRPFWGSWRKDPPRAPATPAAASPTKSQQLAAQARALFEPWDGATREDFALAEQLLKNAVELDRADGDVCAAYGLVLCGQLVFGHERGRARWELAQSVTERAVKLAPKSDQARFAQAFYLRFNDATGAQSEQMLRELAEKLPADKLVQRTLAAKLRNDGKYDEALAILNRVAALPGGDPVALYNKYLVLWAARRHREAEAVVDDALRQWDVPYLYRARLRTRMTLHGDLDGAAAALAKIPATFRLEDGYVFYATQLWLWRREPEKCLAVLTAVPREIVESDFGGPKALLAGVAHRVAGRMEAAKVEWSTALQVAEKQLAIESNSRTWTYWRALLLARLGRTAEAEAALRAYEELSGITAVGGTTAAIYVALGRGSEVVPVFEKYRAQLVSRGNAGELTIFLNALRHDPDWDPLRGDARFQALLERQPSDPK